MNIKIINEPIALDDVREIAKELYRDMVKGVADVRQEIIALGGEWHMDANNELVKHGSQQPDLWGFNIYVDQRNDAAIEYISLINIRPAQGNREMELKDEATRAQIHAIVERLVPELFV